MVTRSQDDAEKALGDLFDLFRQAIDEGNQHFWTRYGEDAHCITSIVRAGLIRCLIADALKKLLDGRPGIHIEERHQTTHFYFGHDWMLQIHKFDDGCRSAVNSTQRGLDLNDNDLETVDLPGIPPSATVIFLGYIENVGDRLAPEMRLTCPDGDSPAWIIDLDAPAPPAPPAEITSPVAPAGPPDGTKVVVRKKKKDSKSG
jgi:hypothetical protein